MKRLPITITVFITITAFACLALIPPGYGSENPELERKVDSLIKVGDYDRAFKLVDGFIHQHPAKSSGHAMLERVITAGSAFLNVEDRKRSLKLIDGFIQRHPEQPIGRAMMVRVLAADRQTDSAFTEYYRFYKLSEAISPELLLEIVRGAINHSDADVKWIAAETAERLGDKGAVPALINAFHDIRVPYHVKTLHLLPSITSALGAFGDKRATSALIKTLDDGDDFTRLQAIGALGELGDKSAVPHLIKALNDENDDDTGCVVEALGELGDERASLALYEVLKASESYDRVRAALALGKVDDGFYREYSVTALIEILNDDSNKAQRRAAKALAELGDDRGVFALIDALNNNSNVSRGSGAQIRLGENGDTRAVPYLIDILNSRYYNMVRLHAAKVLGDLGDERAVPALISTLSSYVDRSSDDPYNIPHMSLSGVVQVYAAAALAKLGDNRGVPHLMSALNDGKDAVRGEAAVALAELGNESIAPNLVDILGRDEGIELKLWVAEALVKLSR